MASEVRETVKGDGFAVGTLDGMGQGPGFRKVRRELDVTAFGVNAIVLPEGYDAGAHYHDKQEELYLVLSGQIEMTLNDEVSFLLGPGAMARVDPPTTRHVRNVADGESTYIVFGGKDGYVGRDGKTADGSEITRPGAG